MILVANMPNLIELSLENNNIKDLKPLSSEEGFRNLKVLLFFKNFIFLILK